MHRSDYKRSTRPQVPTIVKKPRNIPDGAYERTIPIGGGYARMGESIPSAAATARRSNYTQQPRMQSQHTVDSASARYQNDGQKPKLVKLAKEAFKPGMIIRAVVHEPSWERASHSSITVAERQITDTMYGPVISKVRKLIVVANYQDHYAAVPLYSHNGHGLSGKPKPEEFVSVQDHRQNEPFTQLSVHIPLITAHLNRDVNLYEPTTTAYIPYIHPRRYVFPVVHEGYLEPESTRRLLELVDGYYDLATPAAKNLESGFGALSLNPGTKRN